MRHQCSYFYHSLYRLNAIDTLFHNALLRKMSLRNISHAILLFRRLQDDSLCASECQFRHALLLAVPIFRRSPRVSRFWLRGTYAIDDGSHYTQSHASTFRRI